MNAAILEGRFIDFSLSFIKIIDLTKKSEVSRHLAHQIARSGTPSALNYGEAQSAESRKDFIHKLKICLKELRETHVSLKIIEKAKLCNSDGLINEAIKENNELISIFVSSIKTSIKLMKRR